MFIALNEVYYGKTPKLLEAEKLMASLKEDYDGEYYRMGPINRDRRLKQFCQCLADEFGFEKIHIQLQADKRINAATIPISVALECSDRARYKSNFIVDSNGFKYKREAGYIILMIAFPGLVFNPNFSAGEIIGVFLHEIGHNFEYVLHDKMFILSDYAKATSLIRIIVKTVTSDKDEDLAKNVILNVISELLAKGIFSMKARRWLIDILEKSNPDTDLTIDIIDNAVAITNEIKQTFKMINSCIIKANTIPQQMLIKFTKGAVGLITDPGKYIGEKIADNFATVYGYGPELSSALLKVEAYSHEAYTITNIPLVGFLMRNTYGIIQLAGSIFECHPDTMSRCLDQAKYLEEELNQSDLSPECKADIRKQIKKIRDDADEIMRNPQLEKRWTIVQYLYSYIIYKGGGTDIPGVVVGRDVHKQIRKTYDQAIRSLK